MELGKLLNKVISGVPDYQEFMTVDELRNSTRKLVSEHGDVAELAEVGIARTGEPLDALIIRGGDDKIVLAFAFPHPNEPIGSLTLEFLSWRLVKDRELLKGLRSTWIIIKVADIFGARLNEGWFKGPFDIRKYVFNYYRPPPYKQVEWSFPIEYKTLKFDKPTPETKAIMKIIDEWKPSHIYSLHNAGFTGTYYYVTKEPPKEVKEVLKSFPNELGVPIHKGEPEAPYMKKLDTAIFKMPGIRETYDFLQKNLKGKDPAEIIKAGGSSYDYAARVNPDVFELVCEVPYIYDDRLDNDTPIGIPRREILAMVLERNKEIISKMDEYREELSKYTDDSNPFFESFNVFIEVAKGYLEAEENWIRTDPELDRSATVAEAFDAYREVYWGPLLRSGLLYRAINYALREVKSKKDSDALERLSSSVLKDMDNYLETFDKLSEHRVIPIRNLVMIQLAAMLHTVTTM